MLSRYVGKGQDSHIKGPYTRTISHTIPFTIFRRLTDRIVDCRDPEYDHILRIGSGSHSNLKFARNYRSDEAIVAFVCFLNATRFLSRKNKFNQTKIFVVP
jgi:hypothetical protein